MKDIHHERRQRLTGIALMCGAVALFALLDTVAKYLSAQMPTSQIVAARYITAFLLALVLVNPITHPRLVVTGRPVLQIVRSVLMLATTVFNFIAVRYLQLDQTLSIMFSAPFLVALLAGPVLGERLDWRRWAAIAVGFAGVLLVTRPGTGGIHPAALLMFAGALCYAVYGIMTRALARTDSNETTLFYTNLVGVVCMLPILPFVWTPPQDAPFVGADAGDGFPRRPRPLSADCRASARAGVGAIALHLQPDGLDDYAWLSCLRRRS